LHEVTKTRSWAFCQKGITVFGQPNVVDAKTQAWPELLRQAEPATRRGELMVRNLLEDSNVCPALQRQLRDFVAAESAAATPDEAAEQFEGFLQGVRQDHPPCQHPENSANRLPNAPFDRLARSVDGDAFVKYNYLPTNKRKVPKHHRAKPALKAKIRLRELRNRGIQIADLRGSIGGAVVFATSSDIVDQYRVGAVDSDQVRNRLGLDDSGSYGQGQFMVIYVYDADRVTDGRFYRPTVLDAGWKSSAIAFLPSPAVTPQPGHTQDLATGQAAESEVLHAVFPAAEIQECIIAGPLRRNPADNYKAIRLGAGGMPES
jgi:hypothetical protein